MTDSEKSSEKTISENNISEGKKFSWRKDLWQPPRFIGYKICAVLAALLIWGYVMASNNTLTDTLYTVPLEMRNLNSELALMETTNQVQVRVQGNSSDLDKITSSSIAAYLDLTDIKAGNTTLEVKIDLPSGVQLVSVTPNTVEVTLEAVSTAVFPLEVKTIGQPASGYTLMDPVTSPDEVTLSGAKDYINSVGSVIVSADVDDLDSNYSKNLLIQVLDFAGNNITDKFSVNPSTANIVIPVVTDSPEKSLAVNASVIGEPAKGYQVSRVVVEPSTVKAFGDLAQLNSIYYLETEPINLTGLKKSYSQNVNIVVPGGITLSQSSVTVIVQIEPVSTATFKRDIIYAQNLAAGLSCDLSGIQVEVVVSGPETYIDSVAANEIVPYVDCSGISTPGEYTLPLSATLPANVTLVSTDPAQITFKVAEGAK